MEREVIITADGSHSLIVKELGETFHSKHGAVQESAHVYIKNGIELINKPSIKVLEYGFGTGLNALLTLDYATINNKKIVYESIEAYPLSTEEFSNLNYGSFANTQENFQRLHKTTFDTTQIINNNFSLHKHFCKIEDFKTSKTFDIIYFDVFGYDYQQELWAVEILEKAYSFLNEDGIFVTYACKGLINRRLKEIGFDVIKKSGPPGKREMIVAVKKN